MNSATRSSQTFFVELGIKNGASYTFPSGLVHQKTEITHAVNSPAQHVHIFSTTNSELAYATARTLSIDPEPIIRVRLGFSTDSGVFWSQWQDHLAISCKIRPYAEGSAFVIKSADILEKMSRGYVTRFHRGSISDIVQNVAAEHGLVCVIEPTSTFGSFIQNNISDGHFILTRLLDRAINSKGQGNYRLFVVNNVLHFHTLHYFASVRSLDVLGAPGSLTDAGFDAQDSINDGGAGTLICGVDPNQGTAYTIDSSSASRPVHATEFMDTGAIPQWRMCKHPSANGRGELLAMAQFAYEQARLEAFHITSVFSQGVANVNDLFQIRLQSATGSGSVCSGLYSINSLAQVIDNGESTMTINASRGDMLAVGKQAEGARINLLEVEQSSKTKGPSDTFSDGRLVRVVKS